MCWGITATVAMIAAGSVGCALTLRRGDPPAIPLALAYFTLMECLQLGGYAVLDQCGSPANQTITYLSLLHIAFQPLVINAFAMELVHGGVSTRMRRGVFGACAAISVVMLLQLYPFEWAGSCEPGSFLCADRLCTVSGDWHIAWDMPYNGLLVPLEQSIGTRFGFPFYLVAVFALPLIYGAWRFVLFHMFAGPVLAGLLTSNANEVPAIWCLFSIGLLGIALSPSIRRAFETRAAAA